MEFVCGPAPELRGVLILDLSVSNFGLEVELRRGYTSFMLSKYILDATGNRGSYEDAKLR